MTELNIEVAMEQYHKRVEENKGKQIDNSSLHAGSPMYYYCRKCGVETDVLPEGWFGGGPKRICNPCKVLEDHGLV